MINEKELLKVLDSEECIKYNILSKRERLIYDEDIKDSEKNDYEKEVNTLIKKFESISIDTLKTVALIKIKTKRLENIMTDKEYSEHVKTNVYDIRKVNKATIKEVVKSWIKDIKKVTNNNSLHLCFDTESCETKSSYDMMCKYIDKEFPGFDFMDPEWDRLREVKEKIRKDKIVREVRVYSWALGCAGSDKQIHGESLEQYEDTMKIIFEVLKPTDLKDDDKNIIGKSKGIKVEVHNLKWDMEFFKYYWIYKGIRHWHVKTQKDKEKTFVTLEYLDGNIKGREIPIYKEKLSKQPDNTFSIIMGKNQMYECKWQLEEYKEYFKTKEGIQLLPLRRNIHFYDMYKKITKSLKEISEILVIDKHFKKAENYDYKKIRLPGEFLNESEVEYQYNDIYVMTKYLEQVYYNRDMKGTTASSIAFNQLLDTKYKDIKGNKYSKGFLEHFPTMLYNKETYLIRQMYRQSYDGGFTAGVKQYEGIEFDGIIIGIDINSAYPYQMKSGKLPYGRPFYGYGKYNREDPLHNGKVKRDIVFQRVRFDAFERKGKGVNDKGVGYGFIQLNKSKQSLKVNGNNFIIDGLSYSGRERPYTNLGEDLTPVCTDFECYWSEDTLNFMLETHNFYTYERLPVKDKAGNILDLKGAPYEFKTDKKHLGITYVDYLAFPSEVGYFGEFIDINIFKKQIGKLLDNDILSHVSKSGINSCSGKMGSNYIRENIELMEHGNGILGYTKPLDHTREYTVNKEYYVPYISFITDYTRLKLMDIIYKLESQFGFNSCVFQGCDTDSLYLKIPYSKELNTVGKMINYLKSLDIELDPIKLGAWDVEKIIFKYKNLGSKKMMMDYTKLKDIDINMDCLELMELYKNGKIKYDRKVTCAGLPEDTRKEITQKGFSYFAKGVDYVKLVKESCLGGYMLDYDVHEITNNLFN